MMKKNRLQFLSLIMSAVLSASLALPQSALTVYAEPASKTEALSIPEDAIHLSDTDSFLAFAESCTLDTWSQGKTFVLDADLDLSGTEFTSIPTFGGIFYGQDHTISGISLSGGSDYAGLFRYLQKDGEIHQLKVSGSGETESTQTGLALLVGCNYGLIDGCRSYGILTGGDEVGSLAGKNEVTGIISNSIASGSITGKHLAGGIAGSNSGSILSCNNHCSVNTAVSENEINLSSLDRAAADETLTELLTTENAASVTDIGGITGSNSGIIRACINDGNVGYHHVGYNIGGIAGSQTGYIEGCLNYGTLNGRKDVGGIAGQMEPSSEFEFSEDMLDKLDREFDTLHDLLTQLDSDLGSSSTSLTGQVDHLIDSVEGFQLAIDEIMEQTGNDLSDFSNLTDLNSLSSPDPISLDFLDELPSPSWSFSPTPSTSPQESATPSASPQESATPSASPTGNAVASSSPEGDHAAASSSPEGDHAAASSSPEGDRMAVSSSPEGDHSGNEGNDTAGLAVPANAPCPLTATTAAYVPQMLASEPDDIVPQVLYNEEPSGTAAPTGSSTPDASPQFSFDPSFSFSPGPWPSISASLDFDKEAAEDELNKIQDNIYENASQALDGMEETLKDHTSRISARFASARSSLSSNFSSILTDTRLLNSMLDDENQIILDDFQAIIDELNVISDLITNPETTDPDDIMMDVSDQDQPTDISGKVMNSINKGTINGDLNAGGIAGSLSRENNLDPENDLDLGNNSTLNFRYKERIVVRQCSNSGHVNGKKDRIGGIAGEVLLGSILECINTGSVESEGSTVGGIAGYCETSIRSSSAKCSLSGTRQIGGIAGFGSTITDCRSMVEITEGENCLGSIAGTVSSLDEVQNNYFVKGCPAGIDGIDYGGSAEPLSYEAFMQLAGLPAAFDNIYLTFKADEQIVSVVTLNYGESFRINLLPVVPEKEGYIGKWSDFDYKDITFDQTVEAIYTEYVSTLESNLQTEHRPLLLVEGQFEPEDLLSIKAIDAYPDDALTLAMCYRVSVDTPYSDSYVVRYLIPEEMENPRVELYSDNSWVPVDAEKDGSYLVFEVPSQPFVFCCVDRPATPPVILLVALGVCAVVLLGLALSVFLYRKKKKH